MRSNCVNRQGEAIGFIVDRQLHRGGIDVAFFLVATHVQIPVRASVGQAVNQGRDSRGKLKMIGFVGREQRIKIAIR